MIDRILDEKLRHALKERALPGFYWGITAGGALFALVSMITARGTKGFEVLVLILSVLVLIGLVLGAISAYLWREVRSSEQLPNSESGQTWKVVPVVFGGFGAVSAVLLNWFLNSNTNQKELVIISLVVITFCLNFILAGSGLGSLGWLGVVYVRNKNWTFPRPAVRRTAARSAQPFGGPPSSSLLWRARSHLGGLALLAIVLLCLVVVGVWMITPYTPTKPNSAVATLVPATATIIVLPSPTVLPTATSAPTVPPVPAPPTGAPIAQPTAGTSSTVAPPTSTPLPTVRTPTATAPKSTATRTPVPLVCSYKAQSGDTWTTIAQKLGLAPSDLGKLMNKNPNTNPAQLGTTFKSPKTGCP